MTLYAADFQIPHCQPDANTSFPLDVPTLMRAGYVGAVRYVTGAGAISDDEFSHMTTTPGFALALVMETSGTAALSGFGQGQAEAETAFGRAKQLGWPDTRPIYFVGEDNHAVDPSQWPAIAEYFQGVLSVAPVSRVGDYGSPGQINHIMGLGLTTYGWAVSTWAGDPSNCHIRQMANPVPNGPDKFGTCVDIDVILKADWGQWSAVASASSFTMSEPPIPAESERMIVTDDFRSGQIDTFHVDDDGRLVHFWFGAPGPWHGEILATGAKPAGRLAYTRWAQDGMAHVFVEKAGGGQLHRFWDGQHWGADEQDGPVGGSVVG